MDPILSLAGMVAAFVAALAFAYPAAIRWQEKGFNIATLALFLIAFPCVIVCLKCMDRLIDSFVYDRRRGFPVIPKDQQAGEKTDLR
jgi:hypothetical protein